MRFENVIGQQEVKDNLIQAYYSNRVSHAYLFYGFPGVGKLPLALAFAQFLSCVNKQDKDSCGVCPSCIKYEKLIHPDLHFVFPIVSISGKKSICDNFISQWREQIIEKPYFSYNDWMLRLGSENKQGNIYADESTEILHKLGLKTFESDYKVMIIWLPEKMNIACANKLLKILEEPPQSTVFILVSNNRENVLTTILSRTQPLKILGLSNQELEKGIVDEYGIQPEMAKDIASVSNGSMLVASTQINSSEETALNLSQFIKMMRLAYARNLYEAIKWAEDIAKIGIEKQKNFLNYCLMMIRENFILNLKKIELIYMTKDELLFANNFSKFVNTKNVNDLSSMFNKAYYHIERNGNSKIVFTDLCFNIMKVIRN